jgi:hypothetical protein
MMVCFHLSTLPPTLMHRKGGYDVEWRVCVALHCPIHLSEREWANEDEEANVLRLCTHVGISVQ